MTRPNLSASILMVCLLMVGLAALTPMANAAPAGLSFLKSGVTARNNVIEARHRDRRPWISAPIAPSYLAYDYPYYYSRGYYPTHIGPGYIYYGYRYNYRSGYYER